MGTDLAGKPAQGPELLLDVRGLTKVFGSLTACNHVDLQVGKGEITYFWGCLAHALYTPLVRKLNRGESPLVFSFGVLATGCVLLTLWGWSDIRSTDWRALPAIVWITLAYTAFFASAVTFVLLQYAALRMPSAKVMAYTYLVPAWVILWEIAIGRSPPPAMVMIGVGLTVTALVMLLKDEE